MNENQAVNKKKNGGIVTIVLLIIVIIGLVGFIVYDKLNENVGIKENKKIEETNSSKKTKNITNSSKESYKIDIFTTSTMTYNFAKSGKSIAFDQARSNDNNSGLEFTFGNDGNNVYGQLDSNGFYNVVSVGTIENNDSVIILALLKNDSDNYAVYYSNVLSDYVNQTSINVNEVSNKLMNNFIKVNANNEIKSIGKATKNNISYPVIAFDDGNYILSTNGTLEKIN